MHPSPDVNLGTIKLNPLKVGWSDGLFHRLRDESDRCKICGSIEKKNFYRHVANHHSEFPNQPPEDLVDNFQQWEATLAPPRILLQKIQTSDGQSHSIPVEVYSCDSCGTERRKNLLWDHRTKCGDFNRECKEFVNWNSFQCDGCKMRFNEIQDFKWHREQKICEEIKALPRLSLKRLYEPRTLKDGKQDFECSYPECKKVFTKDYAVYDHWARVHSLKGWFVSSHLWCFVLNGFYSCWHCGKKSTTQSWISRSKFDHPCVTPDDSQSVSI